MRSSSSFAKVFVLFFLAPVNLDHWIPQLEGATGVNESNLLFCVEIQITVCLTDGYLPPSLCTH